MSKTAMILVAAALGALAAPARAQSTHVVPNGYAAAEGSTSNSIPWGRGAAASTRAQMLYDSANFTAGGITQPIVITRLRWRANATAATWAGGTYSAATVRMATAAVDALQPSATFAANLGPDVTTVHSGPVTVQAGAGGGIAMRGPWIVDVPLAPGFVYRPGLGNDLVIDVDIPPGTAPGMGLVQLDAQGPGCQASLVANTSAYPWPTGNVSLNHGLVMELTWAPAPGLFADFSASTTGGPSPLTVQFTDRSVSSDPNGVLVWIWDFDGDGLPDSNQQNPTWVYQGCGAFQVSLTVVDSIHSPDTLTRPGLIVTDTITADFTWSRVGASLQFTDRTVPPATAWAWDFDGDQVIDSTLQHPQASLLSCRQDVTLIATRHCRTSSATRAVVTAPLLATTVLTGGAGISHNNTVGTLFDVDVTAAEGISVCGVTIGTFASTAPFTCQVFATAGGYLGKESNAAAWRQVATGTGSRSGGTAGAPSLNEVALSAPFYLAPGRHGLAVFMNGGGTSYIAYTPQALGPFANADLTVIPDPANAPGVVRTTLFTAAGNVVRPGTWNGSLHYTRASLTGTPGYGQLGPGCAGPLGIPGNNALALPRLGQQVIVEVTNLPASSAFFILGFSRTASIFGPLPLDLAGFGAPGCFARVSSEGVVLLVGGNGSATWTLPIPNQVALLGQQFFTQALAFSPNTNALGAVTSDAAAAVVGN